jgi:hypothetical protein
MLFALSPWIAQSAFVVALGHLSGLQCKRSRVRGQLFVSALLGNQFP